MWYPPCLHRLKTQLSTSWRWWQRTATSHSSMPWPASSTMCLTTTTTNRPPSGRLTILVHERGRPAQYRRGLTKCWRCLWTIQMYNCLRSTTPLLTTPSCVRNLSQWATRHRTSRCGPGARCSCRGGWITRWPTPTSFSWWPRTVSSPSGRGWECRCTRGHRRERQRLHSAWTQRDNREQHAL